MPCRRADLLELLLAPLPPGASQGRGGFAARSLGGATFATEGVVTTPPGVVAAMVREADLTPLAGELAAWTVREADAAPPSSFRRSVAYTSRLPWPFADRRFELESWFLARGELPPGLVAAGGVAYVSQTPVGGPGRDGGGTPGGVEGDVEFSGYLFVPLPPAGAGGGPRCWLRRVISVGLALPLPDCMLPTLLRPVFAGDHAWMCAPPADAKAALRRRMASEPAYAAMFGAGDR